MWFYSFCNSNFRNNIQYKNIHLSSNKEFEKELLNLITVEGEFPKILVDLKLILWKNIDNINYIKNFVNKVPLYPDVVYH